MVEITLNHAPYPELSPNSRVHWAVKARAVRAAREEAGWVAKAVWGSRPPMPFAKICYTFVFKSKRRHDIDNLIASMKPALDGLVDAGLLQGDDSQHLTIGCCNVRQGKIEQTIIRVEELESS